MTSTQSVVIAGVDTHSKTHHVAVLDAASGVLLGDAQFPATTAGYTALLTFTQSWGQISRVGVEGTNSYGAGLSRQLRRAGVAVVEVIRPGRAQRRLRGKSDPLDAIAAAREALARSDLPTPKDCDGPVESIRFLHMVRDSAVRSRATVLRQIKMILVSAPANQRERLAHHSDTALLDVLQHSRPGEDVLAGVETATAIALRHLARRHHTLTQEIEETTDQLRALVAFVAPALLAARGVGVVTGAQLLITAGDNPQRITSEAAFAALCGTSPLPASSGQTTRHRLNRSGDRHANCALHQIVLVRMTCDQRTKDYVAKRHADGKSTRETIRCLKRALAREIYHLLTTPPAVPDITDLRPTRLARGIALQDAAAHFGLWPARISMIERGKSRDDTFATNYREWLTHGLDDQ